MKRRTLDIIFAAGGVVVALLLGVVGYLLADQADFAKSYVKDQLGEQKIVFAAAEKLTDEEKGWKSGSKCLTEYAGKTMETGKQAECYANFYIALHMETSAKNAGYPGETYATLGGIRSGLTAQINDAKAKNDTTAAADLQKKLDSATSLRSSMQTGETLRGLLLTSYGFSIFGEKAGQVSIVCYIFAVVMLVLSAAGFVHAFLTAPEKTVFGSAAKGAVPNPS